MKTLIHCCLSLCLLVVSAFDGIAAESKQSKNAASVAQDLQVQMVDSGYTMGDTIAMQASFALAKGETIDPDSLPVAGRVRPWLDIVAVDMSQAGQVVTLNMVWQLFATVEIAQQLSTPPVVLKTAGNQAQQIKIPSQVFYYSPVLPLPPLKNIKRRANQPPPAFDTAMPMLKFIGCAVLFGLLAMVWAWIHDALPWLPFKPGPMTQLARVLKPAASQNTALDQAQLKQVHQALNASAGKSLYADDLMPLIRNAPYFASVQTKVAAFIQHSWQHFYAPSHAQPIHVNDVYDWVKEVAMAERLFRKQSKVSDD